MLIADLHIHSHYSRATSKDLTIEHLALWAQRKGIHVVGAGDIAHPGWLQEMRAKLVPAEQGLFRLRDDVAVAVQENVPPACRQPVRFMLAGEISNIYKRHGAVRKVHNIIFAPFLEIVERIQQALEKIGNIRADGRPILGLDSRDLLEIILEIDPRCHLIPAHIWTPWFSMLGSKSGFDSVEECFGDLTSHIFALETGLSSDPPMNWRVSNLDRYTLVSNSDAHSPQKLGREATVFHCELSYDALFHTLRSGDPTRFGGTIEFFPEEGKYHLDGHRNCGVCWEPAVTLAHKGLCPVCGKELTIGVMHRVETLADRQPGQKPVRTHPYTNLIPLPELLAEVHDAGEGSRRVQQEYAKLLERLGPELAILREMPVEEIAAAGGSRLAEGVARMRRGEVTAQGGYDGEYGVIRIFANETREAGTPQLSMFQEMEKAKREERPVEQPALLNATPPTEPALTLFDLAPVTGSALPAVPTPDDAEWLEWLNDEQRTAVKCIDRPLLIVAGPGAGKTRTLTVRIAHLVRAHGVAPETILAITFTNKAAAEMAERLVGLLGEQQAGRVTVKTFHAFGAQLLAEHGHFLGLADNFAIAADDERRAALGKAAPELSSSAAADALECIADAKNRLLTADEIAAGDAHFARLYTAYNETLAASQMVDFDDLISLPVRLLEEDPMAQQALHRRFRWISVDEFQDINLAQARLLGLLAAGGANLCVIGDPDQAIYGFRGADRRYFLAFQQEHPNAAVIHLRQSYRSPQSLLDAASQVIARSAERSASVALWSDFTEQVKLEIHAAANEHAEAELVVQRIEQMVGGTSYFSLDSGRVDGVANATRSFADFAVLFRLNALVAPLIEAFERSGIPYQAPAQTRLTAFSDVQDALAYLWLLHNPGDRLHLEQVISAGRSSKSAERMGALLKDWHGSLVEMFDVFSRLDGLAASQRRRMADLAVFWRGFAESATDRSVVESIGQVQAFLAQQRGAALPAATQERMQQLTLRAVSYGSQLGAFLTAMLLEGDADAYDPRADRVALMTIHSAKGLEFPVVFMVGCEEGLLPYLPAGRPHDVDEERRLFYVGMTRAQRRLVLSCARRRVLFGQEVQASPSHFIDDIEDTLKEIAAARERRPLQQKNVQLSLF
jgi:uncharacterized protein (TIGR00375 family)